MENNQTNETINAFCDTCDNQANGAKAQLENQGWELYEKCQFCPECN